MKTRTFVVKPEDIQREWWVVDAEGQTLGRLASRIAQVLRGKHKPIYTPHMDTGDFIIVINAEKIRLTGNKRMDKMYYRHSRFPGGLRSTNANDILNGPYAGRVVESAIRGMLPKNKLGRQMFRKLKIYTGDQHPHEAQKPVAIEIA